jgi:hypothetical protein
MAPDFLSVDRCRCDVAQSVEYIAAMCAELEGLAKRADLSSLAYFLAMARVEAQDQRRNCVAPRRRSGERCHAGRAPGEM